MVFKSPINVLAVLASLLVSASATAVEIYPMDKTKPAYAVIGGKSINLSNFKNLSPSDQAHARKVMSDYESVQIKKTYAVKPQAQVVLPLDLADLQVSKVKSGYQDKFALAGKKDRLSIYLAQNEKSARYYGLYKLRMISWNNAKPEKWVTIEKAINKEMHFDFLSIVLDSSNVNVNQLIYLDKRLSAKDADVVRAWMVKHQQHGTQASVLDILVESRVDHKIDTYAL